jgi:hypothetical protein
MDSIYEENLPFGIKDIKKPKERINSPPIVGCETPIKRDTKVNFCKQHGIYVGKTCR